MNTNIERLQSQIVETAARCGSDRWELGKLLGRLKGQLPGHEFREWCRETLRYTARHCRTLIAMSETFTREQLKRHHETKLRLVLAAPARKRGRIMEMIEAGAPRRDIEAAMGYGRGGVRYTRVEKQALLLGEPEQRKLLQALEHALATPAAA